MAGKNTCQKLNVQKIIFEMTASLPSRTKDVIEKRFGLNQAEAITLEAIGQKYGITRERVRQIEYDGLNALRQPQHLGRLNSFFELAQSHLRDRGDFQEEQSLYKELGQTANLAPRQFYFALYLNKNFHYLPAGRQYNAAWTINKNSATKVQKAINNIVKELRMIRRPVSQNEILAVGARHLKQTVGFSLVSDTITNSSLALAKEIASNPFGEYGLVHWADINPRGVRDKAHLIFKRHGKPLHFREVAEHINKASFDSRSAHPQTVHNELIKDQRFVLIGRGIYALKDWGYEPGTVKDVLLQLFKKSRRPLSKDEIVNKVTAQRLVKANTILLNLQNRNYFERTADGKYSLKDEAIAGEA